MKDGERSRWCNRKYLAAITRVFGRIERRTVKIPIGALDQRIGFTAVGTWSHWLRRVSIASKRETDDRFVDSPQKTGK